MFVSMIVLPLLLVITSHAKEDKFGSCKYKGNCPDGSDDCWTDSTKTLKERNLCRNSQDCIDYGYCKSISNDCCCVDYLPYPLQHEGGYCGGASDSSNACNPYLRCLADGVKSSSDSLCEADKARMIATEIISNLECEV